MKKTYLGKLCSMAAAGLLLAACGGGSDSSDGMGRLSLSIIDAPIYDAQAVIVNFVGVVVKPQEGPPLTFYFCEDPADPDVNPPIVQNDACTDSDPHVESIDLLRQTGGASALLLDGVEVPAGRVNWVRLMLDDEAGEIVLSTGTFPLTVPSGPQTGLKLVQGFNIPENGEARVYIDFDVRKSIVETRRGMTPSYKLKPALRLVQDFGTVVGEVDAALMDPTCLGGSIYVFPGAGATPDDIDGDDGDPLSAALVNADANSNTGFSYYAGFLPPGEYTLAFVCADGVSPDGGTTFDEPADDPEEDNQLSFTVAAETATVVVDQVERIDF